MKLERRHNFIAGFLARPLLGVAGRTVARIGRLTLTESLIGTNCGIDRLLS